MKIEAREASSRSKEEETESRARLFLPSSLDHPRRWISSLLTSLRTPFPPSKFFGLSSHSQESSTSLQKQQQPSSSFALYSTLPPLLPLRCPPRPSPSPTLQLESELLSAHRQEQLSQKTEKLVGTSSSRSSFPSQSRRRRKEEKIETSSLRRPSSPFFNRPGSRITPSRTFKPPYPHP